MIDPPQFKGDFGLTTLHLITIAIVLLRDNIIDI